MKIGLSKETGNRFARLEPVLWRLRVWLKRWGAWLLWIGLALILVLNLDRMDAPPTQPSPGLPNTVVISEFSATGGGLLDEDGDASDWIELHNRSGDPVDLTGWTLTDDPTQPDKWTLENITLAPDEYLVIFASNKDRDELDDETPYLHTNFKLNSQEGFLALFPPTSRRFIDATIYEYGPQRAGASFGWAQDAAGAWAKRYLGRPTPGAANDTAQSWVDVLPPVHFSAPHGIYTEAVTVAITHTMADVAIRYTTDGSLPTPDNGRAYTEPIRLAQTTPLRAVALRENHKPSPAATHTYIFLADVLQQPAEPAGWPMTWGTHRVDMGRYRAGEPVQADYAMDMRLFQEDEAAARLRRGLTSLPAVSLVTPMENLDIYASPQDRGPETERPVSVEWIDPSGEDPGFQVDAGVRIQGGAGRWEFMPKHSFRLFFRQEYGPAWLEYPLFQDEPLADSPITRFDTLVLRGGVDESFAGHPTTPDEPVNHRQATYLRDEWARASQIALSGDGSHGRFVHLYLNGLYWGLYNLVERPDESFSATYFGGAKEEWATANHGGAVSGAMDRFHVLLDLAAKGGLENPDAYRTFLEFLDPVQFSDYVILNWYAGNVDWPENNWYANVRNPTGRNRFFVWDAEKTWETGAVLRLGGATAEGAPYPNVVKQVFEAAWASPDFRLTFADRLYHHLHHDGALTPQAAMQRWRRLQEAIDPAILGEVARWGDVRYPDEPVSYADWQEANARVLAQMEDNDQRMLGLARKAGYYPPLDPPAMSRRGGEFSGRVTVTLSLPDAGSADAGSAGGDGTIYYTTDGSDPRTPVSAESGSGGAPAATAQPYAEPVAITTTGTLQARIRVDGAWSPLQQARFVARDEASRVIISEIMYHPYMNEEQEFLELQNIGNTAADLAGAYLTGVDFRFGPETILEPGEYLVLVRNFGEFRERYPQAPVHGQYGGKLSDQGETLTLYTPEREVWLQVRYRDRGGWPLSADGAGDSLVPVDPARNLNNMQNWRASETLHGTPGAGDGTEGIAVP